jgi:periplasmic divalent cation tolerance protein
MTNARVWVVTSTTPTRDDATRLARSAIKERLAAGAEITGPAISIFWHLGEIGEGEEWRVSMRTSAAARDALAARLAELHPWDNPEVSATPVVWCVERYAEWVERTITAGPESAA